MTPYSNHQSVYTGQTVDHAAALFAMGELYAVGSALVAKDPVKAFELWRRAANLGHAAAQAQVGVAYFEGEAVPQDIQQALHYLLLAAAQHDVTAKNWLGLMGEQQTDTPDAVACRAETSEARLFHFVPAATHIARVDQEDGLALCHLAGKYQQGLGVEQDYEQAAKLYERAAARGVPAAMNALANLYRNWPWCAA